MHSTAQAAYVFGPEGQNIGKCKVGLVKGLRSAKKRDADVGKQEGKNCLDRERGCKRGHGNQEAGLQPGRGCCKV